MTVKVEGARRLRATLKKAGADMSQLKEVNRSAAATVAGHSEFNVPFHEGHLKATIRPAATQRAGIVRAGFKRVPYAGVIHWGWPKKNIKAQPWMTDAAKLTEPIWVEQYETHLKAVISQVQGK